MSRSFVARGKPCAPTARPPISTYSTPASARAAISSSGANIRRTTEVVLELGRDAAQPDGLRQARRHRAICGLLPIRLASSLVLPHPPLYSLAVRHASIVVEGAHRRLADLRPGPHAAWRGREARHCVLLPTAIGP